MTRSEAYAVSIMSELRNLPSVDQLLQHPDLSAAISKFGRPLTRDGIRFTLEELRQNFQAGAKIPELGVIIESIMTKLSTWTEPTLKGVINATGVILHTNLGRSPLSSSALRAIADTASGYSSLEYDLNKGKRGSRSIHTEDMITHLTGADGALVVNNNASAVMLILTALARRRRVAVARSQLVEIGGGFRIPDVMKQSGAKLVEVGTTNRVHIQDYQRVIQEQPIVLILRAHQSNFKIIGFTTEPSLKELADLAQDAGLALVDDLGSGTLLNTEEYGLNHEPMVQESLAAGADLVCFSGDKLLGGPQAGIIVGRGDLVTKLKKHPMARAIRADKLCLAALSATLNHYLKNEAQREIPVWQMISATLEDISARAYKWHKVIGSGEVVQGESAVGGGSLPGETLPTMLLSIQREHAHRLMRKLRSMNPPIIARLDANRVLFDPRTVLENQEQLFLEGLSTALLGDD